MKVIVTLNDKQVLRELPSNYRLPTDEELAVIEKEDAIKQAKTKVINQINVLKVKLKDTDYICNKLVEALANNDFDQLDALKTEYSQQLADRQTWRVQINELESQVDDITK